MPKRNRMPQKYEERPYKKRRRHWSVSPSKGRENEMKNETQISQLQIELHILRAQVSLLRRDIHELRLAQPTVQHQERDKEARTGQKDQNGICIMM